MAVPSNWLREYFDAHHSGKGIFKWLHYFDIYDEHFSRFRGKDVTVLEIGVASGGSLEMWKAYFGNEAQIYGVDIRPECKALEAPGISISTGDQANPQFWRSFKTEVTSLDIVIDDGGHKPDQQRVTFEELYPHLSPGGVYVCEDIFGSPNDFVTYLQSWASELNFQDSKRIGRRLKTGDAQRSTRRVSFYPFLAVIEKAEHPVEDFFAERRGDAWIGREARTRERTGGDRARGEKAPSGKAAGATPGAVRNYLALLSLIHGQVHPSTYVEVGVGSGRSLARAGPTTLYVGIDPKPKLRAPIPDSAQIFELTSDEFFSKHDLRVVLQGRSVDLAFIDGMHLFEFALRDFINLERACGREASIVVHDCYPPIAEVAARVRTTSFWTGDVWKLVLCLNEYRPDLSVSVIDTPPSGLALVTKLDPDSTVLAERYEEICERFIDLEYDERAADEMKLHVIPADWSLVMSRLPTVHGSIEEARPAPSTARPPGQKPKRLDDAAVHPGDPAVRQAPRTAGSEGKPLLAFVRIPDTREQTLSSALAANYADKRSTRSFLKNPDEAREELRTISASRSLCQAVVACVPYGLYLRYLPSDTRYMTVLRDPVERVISQYNQQAQAGPRRLKGAWKRLLKTERRERERGPQEAEIILADGDLSLEAGLRRKIYIYDNLMTRFLWGGESLFGELPPDALERAKENILGFWFLGFAERIYDSLIVLGRQLGVELMPHTRSPAAQRAAETHETSAELRELIAEHNALDVELYRFARERFDATNPTSDELGGEVEELRRLSDAVTSEDSGHADEKIARHGITQSHESLRLGPHRTPTDIVLYEYPQPLVDRLQGVAAGLNVTFDAPTTLRYENLIYDPRYPALYDKDGRRVLETCLRRGPGLKNIQLSPPMQIELPEDAKRIDAPVFFCGVLKGHWGHFLTEGIARLWALLDGDVPGSTPLLFHFSRFLSVSWIKKFFHYAGIERDRALEPKKLPIILREVIVPHPSFSMGGEAFATHLALPVRVAQAICDGEPEPSAQPVYLSRKNILSRQAMRRVNEQELEEALAERGVRIVSPEKLSFEDQVRLFNEHHTFIGLVGSAFHSLLYALPGRALRTVVIGPARGSYPNYFMIDHLKGIEASYVYDHATPGSSGDPTLDAKALCAHRKLLSVL